MFRGDRAEASYKNVGVRSRPVQIHTCNPYSHTLLLLHRKKKRLMTSIHITVKILLKLFLTFLPDKNLYQTLNFIQNCQKFDKVVLHNKKLKVFPNQTLSKLFTWKKNTQKTE